MNKDAFKLSIINQFRDSNVAIRVIMLKENAANRVYDYQNFEESKIFFAQEFQTYICIDMVPDVNGRPLFNVRFIDSDQLVSTSRKVPRAIDNPTDSIYNNEVYTEHIVANTDCIKFSLVGARLKMDENYVFKLNVLRKVGNVDYDYINECFVQDPDVVQDVLEGWIAKRESPDKAYMDALVDDKKSARVIDGLDKFGASPEAIARISDAFTHTVPNIESSPMVQIVRSLLGRQRALVK